MGGVPCGRHLKWSRHRERSNGFRMSNGNARGCTRIPDRERPRFLSSITVPARFLQGTWWKHGGHKNSLGSSTSEREAHPWVPSLRRGRHCCAGSAEGHQAAAACSSPQYSSSLPRHLRDRLGSVAARRRRRAARPPARRAVHGQHHGHRTAASAARSSTPSGSPPSGSTSDVTGRAASTRPRPPTTPVAGRLGDDGGAVHRERRPGHPAEGAVPDERGRRRPEGHRDVERQRRSDLPALGPAGRHHAGGREQLQLRPRLAAVRLGDPTRAPHRAGVDRPLADLRHHGALELLAR